MAVEAAAFEILDYPAGALPVRAGLVASQQRAWARLAAPGEWWSGAVRIAIAREARAAEDCGFCRARKAALSPHAVAGRHETAADLPEALVEVVHRIRTDPGRLTRRFYEEALAGGLGDAEYIEAVGVIATVTAVDSFCDAMGVPRRRLPAPLAGEPRRRRPAGAKDGLAWAPTVAPEDVTEAEAGLYDGLSAANIHRALSLVPAEVAGFFDMDAAHYLPDAQLRDFGAEYRALTHAQIEFLAGRVSAINRCVY